MNTLQKALSSGAFILAASIGCTDESCYQKATEFVTGTVIEEGGNINQFITPEDRVSVYSPVKNCDPTYLLKIQFPDGVYTASIRESPQKPLQVLAWSIQEGSHIQLDARLIRAPCLTTHQRFESDKIGFLYSTDINVGSLR